MNLLIIRFFLVVGLSSIGAGCYTSQLQEPWFQEQVRRATEDAEMDVTMDAALLQQEQTLKDRLKDQEKQLSNEQRRLKSLIDDEKNHIDKLRVRIANLRNI